MSADVDSLHQDSNDGINRSQDLQYGVPDVAEDDFIVDYEFVEPEALDENHNGHFEAVPEAVVASQPSSAKFSKRVLPCQHCHVTHLACNEVKPCERCVAAGISCKPRVPKRKLSDLDPSPPAHSESRDEPNINIQNLESDQELSATDDGTGDRKKKICFVCNYEAVSGDDLGLHRRSSHARKVEYTCTSCNMGFRIQCECEKHLKSKHGLLTAEAMLSSGLVKATELALDEPLSIGTLTICKFCGEAMERQLYRVHDCRKGRLDKFAQPLLPIRRSVYKKLVEKDKVEKSSRIQKEAPSEDPETSVRHFKKAKRFHFEPASESDSSPMDFEKIAPKKSGLQSSMVEEPFESEPSFESEPLPFDSSFCRKCGVEVNRFSKDLHVCDSKTMRSIETSALRRLRSFEGSIDEPSKSEKEKTTDELNLSSNPSPSSKTRTGKHQCAFCDWCDKSLVAFQDHMYMHTGETPHACPHCDYRSSFRSSLRRHIMKNH